MLANKTFKANLALSMSALFWGTTFIFQRDAMNHLSPLAYTGARFLLGALALLPFALPGLRRAWAGGSAYGYDKRLRLAGPLLSGTFIFVGMCFQQYGLVWTTAGKAGFITSLYVVIVPVILLVIGRKLLFAEGLGAVLALTGLYLLSFTGITTLAPGDGIVLIGSFVWAGHVICLSWLAPKMDAMVLGFGQALVTGTLALTAACLFNQLPTLAELSAAGVAILWGGILSVSFGFTFQVIGQRNATPAAAAIILQMEAVIAALAGWIALDERMTARMLTGAGVMLAGLLISQLWPILQRGAQPPAPPESMN